MQADNHLKAWEAEIRADERKKCVKETERLVQLTDNFIDAVLGYSHQEHQRLLDAGVKLRATITALSSGATAKKWRGHIAVTPDRIDAVQRAIGMVLREDPHKQIWRPSELLGYAQGLGNQTIAAVLDHLGYVRKGGAWHAPTQGHSQPDVGADS